MRAVLLSLAFSFALLFAAPARSAAVAVSHDGSLSAPQTPAVFALQIPDKKIEVTVGDRAGGGGRWYRSPVWIAIGAIAVVVILLLIVLAVRGGGGGTTIVRD